MKQQVSQAPVVEKKEEEQQPFQVIKVNDKKKTVQPIFKIEKIEKPVKKPESQPSQQLVM